MITLAISKGRMQDEVIALLAASGVSISAAALASRRLAVEDESQLYRIIFVRPADVPVYVEHGIADCGFVGRDVLMESDADLLRPLDLGIGYCRLVVAAPNVDILNSDIGMLRVATKYVKVAAAHFGDRGIPVEIIPLSGSVELAPALGLADVIFDLVETGRTLQENGLFVVEEVAESSACLVVNRASYQLKTQAVTKLIGALSANVKRQVTQ
jgi:ATP phosphoribosyltransferase